MISHFEGCIFAGRTLIGGETINNIQSRVLWSQDWSPSARSELSEPSPTLARKLLEPAFAVQGVTSCFAIDPDPNHQPF
jgi:hypothetical protein